MVKNPLANAGDIRDTGSIPGSGRSPGERNGNLLQYSCLGNLMDRGAWQARVHGVVRVGHYSATKYSIAQCLMVVPCPFPSVSKEGFEF